MTGSKAFLLQRNHRMALVNGAVACEVLLGDLLRSEFLGEGRASKNEVNVFLQKFSKGELPELMTILGLHTSVLTKELKQAITRVFGVRNGVLHGKRRHVSEDEAAAAIRTAEKLAQLRPT